MSVALSHLVQAAGRVAIMHAVLVDLGIGSDRCCNVFAYAYVPA